MAGTRNRMSAETMSDLIACGFPVQSGPSYLGDGDSLNSFGITPNGFRRPAPAEGSSEFRRAAVQEITVIPLDVTGEVEPPESIVSAELAAAPFDVSRYQDVTAMAVATALRLSGTPSQEGRPTTPTPFSLRYAGVTL